MDSFAVIFVVFIGLVIPFGLLAIGLVCYIRLRRSVLFRNVLSSFVMLLIGVPIGAFITAVIPTFIGSLFLPPGYAEWIMYGIVAVVTPILLLGWWHRVKLLFSKDYRGVVISNPERMPFYQSLPELPVSRGDTNIIKTRQARKGTTNAKLRSAVGHVAFPSLLIAILALRKIPLLGILFSPLTAGAMGKFGRKLDNLREEVKRLEAPTLAEVLEADSRKPVLLLRSFLDDQFEVQSLDSENKNTDSVTFEELICRTASGWGPVVAIGEPGEEMPHLGAARAYFTNETWQAHALDLLERSRVVLMVMGKTPSVGWELARIFERKYFSKTIVIFPPCDEISLAQRLLVFQKVFQEMTGNSFELRIAPDHVPLAVTFDGEGQYLVISGPFADSPVYQDVLLLGSRVIHANAVNGAES